MFNAISLKTDNRVGLLPQFSLAYKSRMGSPFRELGIVYAEDEYDCIVFTDSELPVGSSYEIRGDGIWFDANCEIEKEHWSFSMESFALRVSVDEYLAHLETPDSLLIGDRIPFGFEIDAIATAEDSWKLSGDVLVVKNEIEFSEITVQLNLE